MSDRRESLFLWLCPMPEEATSKESNGADYEGDHSHRVVPEPRKPFDALLKVGDLLVEPVGLPVGEPNHVEEDDETKNEEEVEDSEK